ncbi:polysaccharide biosynthesis protein GumE [Xanthomonas translucens pv. graminis]|uniref:Polysaccharide biosynthesis protein GumE n=2 Tax=Xanthomonas translucens group TaxID=3390202 RepID=A0A1M4L4Y7_9XANT|nr:putative xanthan polymerase [Xanthomonas translucens pv. graminis ART-Xtg29]OAX59780.1 polysaccharide biosynthesis protein GumE [Xanthomonas translucens pv. graminis]SBV42247.1 polysaccharide biosynthesis protein GumE [Xanthomonas translucens pv. graminis]SBV42922.1 polysaccharide biosynthesis protein GumE [Xanthomonas translucens pv. graminis]SBV47468.1 polysaccharide biosynthesis protein GumE [Xanthomonas translucens pv. graminis ART-Xtg29]
MLNTAIDAPPMTLREQRHNLLIELVLLFAIGYNFLLAVVNAKVFRVSPAMTYVVEVAIYGACFLIGLWSLDRKRTAMVFTGIGLLALLMLVRLFLVWSIDPKFFRDALIPFAFLVLGAAYTGSLPKLFLRMALVVSLVAAFELALPKVYGDVVNPKSYFVNARGASASSFWNQDSNLFVSATRPGARNFLPSSNLPRASSVFIEPVTMGNFIIFFTAILLTFWRWMRPVGIAASVAMIGFLIVASDGRLAAGTCVMMVALTPLLLRMDQRLGFLIFFGVLLGAWLMVWASGIQSYEDTTLGRVFFTVYSIRNMTAESWLGLDFDTPYNYFDSGIAYFISSQSVVLVLAFLLAYSFAMLMRTIEGQLFKNLLIFAFALSLLVSNGYFSIKTAALWWFVCGCLWQMVPRRATADALPAASDTPPRTAVAT